MNYGKNPGLPEPMRHGHLGMSRTSWQYYATDLQDARLILIKKTIYDY